MAPDMAEHEESKPLVLKSRLRQIRIVNLLDLQFFHA